MHGRKSFQPKTIFFTSLNELVPYDNFYRKLNNAISLHWIYKSTAVYLAMT
ncbi:MAG: hypothetical protein IPK18_00550 [Sphingobacteriales bacterium]|nr:MAG: hypothetical protein IPK18_00550 [Sphingobacteriales bacterium]